jgi:hypothetical protein|tara:strand:+ start:775 stop:1335 length:561 start_codon:yes stop_codon:yes gene_type:complete
MEYFVRVILDEKQEISYLNESIFPSQNLLETADGRPVFEIILERHLADNEADEYAERLANYMFEQGYKNFDIEISAEENIVEETYHGNEFHEAFGELWFNEDDQLDEAEYQGRKVPLGKPMQGDVKKFKVYVKDPSTGNTKKVNFGDPDMKIKKSNPARRRSFRARHNCDNPGPRTKARYWSCRKW